jgi:ribosomal protein L16 Arg81 hydroxylase
MKQAARAKAHQEREVTPNEGSRTTNQFSALRFLIGDFDPQKFVDEHWGKKPLHIKGDGTRFTSLFSREHFIRIATSPSAAAGGVSCLARFGQKWEREVQQRIGAESNFDISPGQAEKAILAGATLTLRPIETIHPPVRRLISLLKSELGYAGSVNCASWLSSPGVGAAAHFDASSVFMCQIAGKKTWRLSKSTALPHPKSYAFLGPEGPYYFMTRNQEPEPWQLDIAPFSKENSFEVEMNPGDVLFFPGGVWHETTAGDEESLGLQFVFDPVDFSEIIKAVVEETFTSRPEWRHLPPVVAGGSLSEESPPKEIREFFDARLDELRAVLNSLSGSSASLNKIWTSMIASNVRPPRFTNPQSAEPVPPVGAMPAIERKTLLRLSEKATVSACTVPGKDAGKVLYVYVGSTEIEFDDPGFLAFGERLVERGDFVAEAACRWSGEEPYPWETVRGYLTSLAERGVVEIVVDPARLVELK